MAKDHQNKTNIVKTIIIRTIIFIFIVFFVLLFYFENKLNIEVVVNNNKVNELMDINIYIKKGSNYVEATDVKFDLHHMYKKDEEVSLELTPYAPGEYIFYYYPQVQGEYVVDVSANIDGITKYKNTTIEVE